MSAPREKCPTCLAMADRDFTRQTPEHAVELGHIAGMVVGVLLVGGHSAREAREQTKRMLCDEHARDLLQASRFLSDVFKKGPPS